MLEEQKTGNKTFLNIINGNLSQKLKEPTDKTIERKNSNGETVHERRFGAVSGFITGIKIDESGNYGQMLQVDIEDKGEKVQIQCNLDSGYAYDFLSRVEGVDFTKPVRLASYKIAREDNPEKFNYLFVIEQENAKVAKRYTKENPNGLPSATSKTVGKKTKWDFSEITAFYYKIATDTGEKIKKQISEIRLNAES